MTRAQNELPRFDLADSNVLLGRPPILSSENAEHYAEIWNRLTADFKPSDIAELLLIRNFIDATWEALRYVRHRTLSVERRFRQSLEFQQTRADEIKARREKEIRRLAQKLGVPPDELARKFQLDCELEEILSDTNEIFARIPNELDHARALESAIGYHEQLETLINGARRRQDDALEQLELYRAGLGQILRKESDQIIDAACKMIEEPSQRIEGPSIVPNDGEGAAS